MRLRRRDLFRGAAGAALWALPLVSSVGCSIVREPDALATGPFRHGVASGDPLPDAVILWTRATQNGEAAAPVEVTWEIAKDATFSAIVGTGAVTTDAARDFTVKVDATGLEAGTTYYYRFRGLGVTSAIGRTRTAPRTASQLRFAVASCSNYAEGYFHAYRAIAKRADIDAVIHLGDYIYEYADGEYGDERKSVPLNETKSLADYRARYSQYRLDPDLREAHRQHPFITTWDDHEVADNSYKGGSGTTVAEAHEERRRAAFQAYAEWMPIRGELADGKIWRALRYGDLADLLILDTRHWAKEKQTNSTEMTRFAADRQILGADQEAWFFDELRASKAQWKLVCQQVLMSPLPQYLNTDQWDGYPAARDRFYDAIEKGGVKDVVVLTGDIHASFANDLARRPTEPGGYDPATGKGSLAVEIVTPAITSETPSKPSAVQVLLENKWVKHVNMERHGFVLLDLDRDRAHAAFHYVKDVESREGQDAEFSKGVATRTGENFLRDAGGLPERPQPPVLAPESIALDVGPQRTLPAKRPGRRHKDKFGALRRIPHTRSGVD